MKSFGIFAQATIHTSLVRYLRKQKKGQRFLFVCHFAAEHTRRTTIYAKLSIEATINRTSSTYNSILCSEQKHIYLLEYEVSHVSWSKFSLSCLLATSPVIFSALCSNKNNLNFPRSSHLHQHHHMYTS